MAEKVTIGNCELWHGDCRELLPAFAPCDLILTDPPYGAAYAANPIVGKGKAQSNHEAMDFLRNNRGHGVNQRVNSV